MNVLYIILNYGWSIMLAFSSFVIVLSLYHGIRIFMHTSVQFRLFIDNSSKWIWHKFVIVPLRVSVIFLVITLNIIISILTVFLTYLIKYGRKIVPFSAVTLWKIQQYGPSLLSEYAPSMIKWVRNVYNNYVRWAYRERYTTNNFIYIIVFLLGYWCRWIGYIMYLGYYYSIYVIRHVLLIVITPYVIEIVFFLVYYIYRTLHYYLASSIYKLLWKVYVGIRTQLYYILPNFIIYHVRRFLNRSWDEWFFAENIDADGQTPEFIYIENPLPTIIKVFQEVRPHSINEKIWGLGYIYMIIPVMWGGLWLLFIIMPLYMIIQGLHILCAFSTHITWSGIAYYRSSLRLQSYVAELGLKYDRVAGLLHLLLALLNKIAQLAAKIFAGIYISCVIYIPWFVHTGGVILLSYSFYILYGIVWFLYNMPRFVGISLVGIIHMLYYYRVYILMACILYWVNYEYYVGVLQLIENTIHSIISWLFYHTPSWVMVVNTISSSFSMYDYILQVGPQIAHKASYPPVHTSIGFMERMPFTPHVVGYARYYQLYDLAHCHPRMKYWYSPVVYRWWDELYYFYTDYIYAWLNLDPRSRWLHLGVKVNSNIWKPYQVTHAWSNFAYWGCNFIPAFTMEGSVIRANMFVTTPAQENALRELEAPWSRVIFWPYGVTRLCSGGVVDYNVGGRYIMGAISDYDAYSYVDIYRDGSAEAFEVWQIRKIQTDIVNAGFKIAWPFFYELQSTPTLSRGDMESNEGTLLQPISYVNKQGAIYQEFYSRLVEWKWSIFNNMPHLLQRKDKYTWLNHLEALGRKWGLYKMYLYTRFVRPFHGRLYDIMNWAKGVWIGLLWNVINSVGIFWLKYSAYNNIYKVYIWIAVFQQLIIVYPCTWVFFVWNLANAYYSMLNVSSIFIYTYIHYLIMGCWSHLSHVITILNSSMGHFSLLNLPFTSTYIVTSAAPAFWYKDLVHSLYDYLCCNDLISMTYYHAKCYYWYVSNIMNGYMRLMVIDSSLAWEKPHLSNVKIRLGKYLDTVLGPQYLTNIHEWILLQQSPLLPTQPLVLPYDEIEQVEKIPLPSRTKSSKTEVVNGFTPPPSTYNYVNEGKVVTQWQQLMNLLCVSGVYKYISHNISHHVYEMVGFIIFILNKWWDGTHITCTGVGSWMGYGLDNWLYVPIVIISKLQYWIDTWCIELQLPRRLQKYKLLYEHRKIGGHIKGHGHDLTYMRISASRRALLFSTHKWQVWNMMHYLQFITHGQGGILNMQMGVGVTHTATIVQPMHSTTLMFNYVSQYIWSSLGLCSVIMYYITFAVLIMCSNSFTSLFCVNSIGGGYNREYAWNRFRAQTARELDWMWVSGEQKKVLKHYFSIISSNTNKLPYYQYLLSLKEDIIIHNGPLFKLVNELEKFKVKQDTRLLIQEVWEVATNDKYKYLCNNLQLPSDIFTKVMALGFSRDKWLKYVHGGDEEEDYVEWDKHHTYDPAYATLHVGKFSKLYSILWELEQNYSTVAFPSWVWHKDPYNIHVMAREVSDDATATLSYVYQERVDDSPYVPWGLLTWGLVVPTILFLKPLVFMGKWWHHTNRPAYMLTHQLNFYMETILHHIGLMDYMAFLIPRDVINGKLAGYPHVLKTDMRRVYPLSHESVYGSNFYVNYLAENRIWWSQVHKIFQWKVYGGINCAVEGMRLLYFFNLISVLLLCIYLFIKVSVQHKSGTGITPSVNYTHITGYLWIKHHAQRMFVWFWR